MERGKCQVSLGDSLVDEGLHIGLGEHAATARYGIDRLALFGKLVELFGGHMQERGDLVDEGSGAARAGAVHAHILYLKVSRVLVEREEDHLGILPAQFDGGARVRIELLERGCVGHHLLDEGHPQRFGKSRAA